MSDILQGRTKRFPKRSRRMQIDFNFLPKQTSKCTFSEEAFASLISENVAISEAGSFEKKLFEEMTIYSAAKQPVEPKREGSFSQDLFNNETSVKIREAAKNSTFIQGMAKGTLDPDDYGGYNVQDAAYCFNAVEAFDFAAEKEQLNGSPIFALLYRVQSESYRSYNQEFVKTWRLKNTESVVMGPAAAMYVGYEKCLSRKDPKFLSIAMLPCLMLWPWIASELIDSVDPKNPYYGWFKENMPDPVGHKSTGEKFVDHFFTSEEKGKSQLIFLEGMVNELNFFRDACDESLYYYSNFNT